MPDDYFLVVDKEIATKLNNNSVPAMVALLNTLGLHTINPTLMITPLILFCIILIFLYVKTNQERKLSYPENKFIFIGTLIATTILLLYYIADTTRHVFQWDETAQELVVITTTEKADHGIKVIIDEHNPFADNNNEKKTDIYWVLKETYYKTIRKNNTKTMDWDIWRDKIMSSNSVVTKNILDGLNEVEALKWIHQNSFSSRLSTILLTVAIVVLGWSSKVYSRIGLWIYTIAIFEICLNIWVVLPSQNFTRKFAYLKDRLQIMSACLGIVFLSFVLGTSAASSKDLLNV
jgi:Ca2+/Na+ antiporter